MFKLLRCIGVRRDVARTGNVLSKRFFLSEAFKCTEAWERRLKAPIFKKINREFLYNELDKTLSIGYRINVLDVDLLVSSMKDDFFQGEVEEIIFKVRLNPETTVMPERTSHALIRFYLSLGKKEDLFNVLSQRLSYGIFPDYYLSILMMDMFLKENDALSAMKIAVLQMLQEDCDYPVLKTFALYSCIKYLNSDDVWSVPKVDEDGDDDEEVKVRVPFLRNEYFDDHFDIVNTNHLVGKALYMFGKTFEGPIGASCQLIGLILYEKFDKAKALFNNLNESNATLYAEAVQKAKDYLINKPKQPPAEEEGKEGGKPESVNEEMPIKAELQNLLDSIPEKRLLSGKLQEDIEKMLTKEVAENEEKLIKEQCEIYEKWEKEREDHIKDETLMSKMKKDQEEIAKIKEELKLEEERIFYFDNEDNLEQIIEENKRNQENVKEYTPRNRKEREMLQAYKLQKQYRK